MSDLLGIGVSGLLAFQKALGTTGNNIVNVNTPGYSRQSTELASRTGHLMGGHYIGSGVEVGQIKRIYDNLSISELRDRTMTHHEYETYLKYADRIDELVADPDLGISGGLNEFFDRWQKVAADPANIPVRQLLLTQSELLTGQFHRMYEALGTTEKALHEHLLRDVQNINTLTAPT